MTCDMVALLLQIHYEGSHVRCVETREGHTFSPARELTATGYKQQAVNEGAVCLRCGLTGGVSARQAARNKTDNYYFVCFTM